MSGTHNHLRFARGPLAILIGSLPVLAIASITMSMPVTPDHSAPGRSTNSFLVPLVATAPASMIATLAPFAGLADARIVQQKGGETMDGCFELVDNRLDNSDWWHRESRSVMDAYLNWVFYRVSGARYDTSRFSNFERHAASSRTRPAIQRALAKEREAVENLEARGLLFVPPGSREFA